MISPEQQAELSLHHEQWKQHSVTKQFSVILDDMEKRLVDFVATKSTDNTVEDAEIRRWAAQINQLKQTKQLIYDTTRFVNKINAHDQKS